MLGALLAFFMTFVRSSRTDTADELDEFRRLKRATAHDIKRPWRLFGFGRRIVPVYFHPLTTTRQFSPVSVVHPGTEVALTPLQPPISGAGRPICASAWRPPAGGPGLPVTQAWPCESVRCAFAGAGAHHSARDRIIKNCTVRLGKRFELPEMTAVSRNDATGHDPHRGAGMTLNSSTNSLSGNSLTYSSGACYPLTS